MDVYRMRAALLVREGRIQLIATYGGFTEALAVRGVELMEQAIVDLDDVPLDVLWHRFLAWTAPLNAQAVPAEAP
jgi:hypothetical protein